MSRFAVDPRWLVYLPPTMAPRETSSRDDYLEHPAEAFAYYRREGATQVAPFHLLASEGSVHADREHLWHLEMAEALSEAESELLVATAHRTVDLNFGLADRW